MKKLNCIFFFLVCMFINISSTIAQTGAPHTLRGKSKVSNVSLSWKSPTDPRTLQWHSDRDYDGINGESINGKIPQLYIANQFTPSDLKEYAGAIIDSMVYFHYRPVLEVTLLIMEDGNIVREQIVDINGLTLNKKHSVLLDTPYTIRDDVTLTLAVKFIHGTNLDFIGIMDQGPAVPGKGNLYSFDGQTWMQISRGNFLVTGHISMPKSNEPNGYNVYRGETKVNESLITEKTIELKNEPKGTWVYKVASVYEDKEFVTGGLKLTNVPLSDLRPTACNFRGSVTGLVGTLTWDAPFCANSLLTWSSGDGDKALGGTSGTTRKIWVTNSFTSDQLISFTDHQITAINAVLNTAVLTMKLVILENGKIVYSEDVPEDVLKNITLNNWTKFALSTPYTINPAADLKFGYYITHATGLYPAKVDQGPAKLYGCYIATTTPKTDFNQTTPTWTAIEKTVSANWMLSADVSGSTNYATVASYDVYCNDYLLKSSVTSTTCDVEGTPGTFNYKIVTKYNDGTNSSPTPAVSCTYLLPGEYMAPVWTTKSFEDGTLALQWEIFRNLPSEIKHYDTPTYNYQLTNDGEDIDIYMGAQFSVTEISAYNNYEITGVSLMLYDQFKSLTVLVRSGKTLLASKTVTTLPLKEIQSIEFDTPVDMPLDAPLTVGYRIVYQDGKYPIVMDQGPVKTGGAQISFDGNTWSSLSMIDKDATNLIVGANVRIKESTPQSVPANNHPQQYKLKELLQTITTLTSEAQYGLNVPQAVAMKTAEPEIKSYRLYCNNELVEETTNTDYTATLPYGIYNYEVAAVYTNGWESARSTSFEVRYQQPNLAPAPYGLNGIFEGKNLQLTWASPESADELSWQRKDGGSLAVGLTRSSGVTGWFFIAYDADELKDHVGDYISHIKIGLYEINLTSLKAVICIDRNVIYEQEVDLATVKSGENIVRLDKPFEIPANREVCVGYYVAHPNNVKPNLTDEGPAIDNKGNLIYTGSWKTLLSMNSSLNYNWRIAGVIQKKSVVLKSVGQQAEDNTPTYTVYLDGNPLQTNLTETNYKIENAVKGSYWVTSTKDNEESAPSNTVVIDSENALSSIDADRFLYNQETMIFDCTDEATLSVFDARGRLVKQRITSAISLSDLTNGIYIIEVKNQENKVIRVKVAR